MQHRIQKIKAHTLSFIENLIHTGKKLIGIKLLSSGEEPIGNALLVGRWVCLQQKIRTKIQDERNAVEHQEENKNC